MITSTERLAEAEVIARGVAYLNPWVVAIMAEYDRRGARIAELEADLAAEEARYDALLAESGGVSSPPCIPVRQEINDGE